MYNNILQIKWKFNIRKKKRLSSAYSCNFQFPFSQIIANINLNWLVNLYKFISFVSLFKVDMRRYFSVTEYNKMQ